MHKQPYIPPTITVVAFRSEKGYANSGGIIGVPQEGLIELLNYESGSQETESFIPHDTWTDGSNGFWN